MNFTNHYINTINALIDRCSAAECVVIFGASRGGWYISQVLQYFDIFVTCFIDNDQEKHGQLYNGIEVTSPELALANHPNASVFLGILNPSNHADINHQLIKLGYKSISNDIDAFLYIYFTQVVDRTFDIKLYAKALDSYFNQDHLKLSIAPTVSYMITEKCSLNCQDCGAFVPENNNPETYDVDTIVRDIEVFCGAFDVVHHIALQGGEPFLHPKLDEITERVAKIPNLLFVDYVTNGTIVPNEKKLNAISRNGYTVLISDYGSDASTKVRKLTSALEANAIHYDYYRYEGTDWGKQFPIFHRQRTAKTNDEFFLECISNKFLCMQIMNGEVHRCSFSNNAGKLGFIEKFSDDYVSIDSALTSEQLSDEIRLLAYRKQALHACDYCPSMEREKVLAGIQLPRNKPKRQLS